MYQIESVQCTHRSFQLHANGSAIIQAKCTMFLEQGPQVGPKGLHDQERVWGCLGLHMPKAGKKTCEILPQLSLQAIQD